MMTVVVSLVNRKCGTPLQSRCVVFLSMQNAISFRLFGRNSDDTEAAGGDAQGPNVLGLHDLLWAVSLLLLLGC